MNDSKLTIPEQIEKYLSTKNIGCVISASTLKKDLHILTGQSKESYLPYDYCYNSYCKDSQWDRKNRILFFERLEKRGLYKYLGKDYPYTGNVYDKNGKIYGQWKNGIFTKNGNEIIEPMIINVKEKNNNIEQNLKLYEGICKEVTILQKDRNQKVIKLVKEQDNFTCQACGFYYENKIVEAHHLTPISNKDEEYLVTLEHLITLCPNCHALAHILLDKDDKYQDREILIKKIKSIIKEFN